MKKSKIKNWVVALGIGATFALGIWKNCNHEAPEVKKGTTTTSPYVSRMKEKIKIYFPQEIPSSLKEVLTRKKLEEDFYSFGLHACLDADNIPNASRIFSFNNEHEKAMSLLEARGFYYLAAKMAAEAGELERAKDNYLRNSESPVWAVANDLADIGEYDTAMGILEKYGLKRERIELALEYGDIDAARSIFEEAISNGAEDTIFFNYPAEGTRAMGYWDVFLALCAAKEDWHWCHTDVNEYLVEEEPAMALPELLRREEYGIALLVAKDLGVSVPGLEEKVTSTIEIGSKMGYLPYNLDDIIRMGYGDLAWDGLHEYAHERMLESSIPAGDFLDLGKKLGYADEIIDYFDMLLATYPENSDTLYFALEVAKDLGLPAEEKRFAEVFLERMGKPPYGYLLRDTIEALVLLERMDDAYALCKNFLASSEKCYCAYYLMQAMRPEEHNYSL